MMIHNSRKIAFLVCLSLFFSYEPVSTEPALDFRGDHTVNYFSRYSDIVIQTDKVQYDAGEEIPVKFRITNTGYQVIRIYPSSEMNRSFQFMVLDARGREIESDAEHMKGSRRYPNAKKVVSYEGESVKEIILHPEETYEKTIYLNDLFTLSPGQEFRVSGYFYPDVHQEFFVRSSNQIKVRIGRDRRSDFLNEDHSFQTNPENPSLSPEETVYLFLSAELKKNWPNYLKYLELNKYITAYDRFATRFAEASEMERPVILKDFGDYLSGGRSEELKRFKIIQVKFDRALSGKILDHGRSYVIVHAERDTRGFIERYEYTYSLEKSLDRDGFWKIVHVTARLID